jgi:hypothetical protein
MEYLINLLIIIIIVYFKGIRKLNKNIDQIILKDTRKHFERENYKVVEIRRFDSKHDKGIIPFHTDEWSPSTGIRRRNYYANKFWRVRIDDNDNNTITKWVNTGHFFTYQVHLIVKD